MLNGTPEPPDPHFYLPDGRVVVGQNPRVVEGKKGFERIEGLMNRREWRQLQAVLHSQFFLFLNGGGDSGYGERPVCKRRMPDGSWRGCGRKHMYFSSYCVEMPFRGGEGFEEGLWLTFRVASSEARRQAILKTISKLPDLAQGHPLTAADLTPKDSGEDWLGVMLSRPEPIKEAKALEFATKINEAHPPQPYCLLKDCYHYLTPNTDCALGRHFFPAGSRAGAL